jgi:hypothetical protein
MFQPDGNLDAPTVQFGRIDLQLSDVMSVDKLFVRSIQGKLK